MMAFRCRSAGGGDRLLSVARWAKESRTCPAVCVGIRHSPLPGGQGAAPSALQPVSVSDGVLFVRAKSTQKLAQGQAPWVSPGALAHAVGQNGQRFR